MRVFIVGAYLAAHYLNVGALPRVGEIVAARDYFSDHGGKALNLAVGLARLGVETDFLAAIGRDAAGDSAEALLRAEGVSGAGLVRVEAATGFGVGLIAGDGANMLCVYMGAAQKLDAEHVRAKALEIARAQVVAAQFEVDDAPILAAFRLGRTAGAKNLLNPSPWRACDPEIFALADLILLNQPEAADFFAAPEAAFWPPQTWTARLAQLCAARGAAGKIVVVTLAEQGAVALDGQGLAHHDPAFAIDQIDATGAGDGFCAGLLWALGRGDAIGAALRPANGCGALVARGAKILPHLPSPDALQEFIRASRG